MSSRINEPDRLPVDRVKPPRTEAEVHARVAGARRWARAYTRLGWAVTPSCPGHSDGTENWGTSCIDPDAHPAPGGRWRREAATDWGAVDRAWRHRPRAYGILLRPGAGVHALYLYGQEWDDITAAVQAANVPAPLMRLWMRRRGPERLVALVSDEVPIGSPLFAQRIRSHFPDHALPLPAADAGGHAVWALPPIAGEPLPPVAALLAALAPLYRP